MHFHLLQVSFWVIAAIYAIAAVLALFQKQYPVKSRFVLMGADLLLCVGSVGLAIYHYTLAGTVGGVIFAILSAAAVTGARAEGKNLKSFGYLVLLAMLIVGVIKQ